MLSSALHLKTPRVAAVCAAFLFAGVAAIGQKPAARIGSVVDSSRAVVPSSRPIADSSISDAGAVPDAMLLQGMTIVFNRSASQQAALDALTVAQQNPASPQYHQWLTPDQFAAQFGLADSDLTAVTAWLQRQGFTGAVISRSRDRVSFTGSAAQFASAFGSPIHYFSKNGEKHFGPSAEVSVPAAIAPTVLGLEHVTDLRAKPFMKKVATPALTSSQSGSHYMTPKDVATIYDVNAAYNAGYTGVNQQIAVIGQSAVVATDITNFQTAAGVPVRAPQMVLVPNSGASTVYEGDEAESDLDLEYSSAMGKSATVFFVYTGSSANADVSTALEYAISNRIASILTISYGYCEGESGFTSLSQTFNNSLQQASVQGQTVIAASGDQGALSCYGSSGTPYVSYPASSQYVTAVGGTEFPCGDVLNAATAACPTITSSQFWQPATTSTGDVIGSAISYIPEMAWNDNSTSNGLSAGGGGVSLYFPKPTWQTGVAGIPTSSFRLVPDISLDSSEVNAPYLYCSSDASATSGGSCSNGTFRNTTGTGYFTAAGGTSFAAPIFAGLLSIIEQKLNTNGLGLLGPTLYSLASNSTTYASAFHDITSGTTACTLNSAYPISFNSNGTVSQYGQTCTTVDAASFPTGTGYDEATGLGSIDLNNIMNAWPAVTTLAGSRVTIAAGSTSVAANANDTLAIAVAPASGSGTAAGTVAITVDGTAITTLTLVNGVASYVFTSPVSGNHSVVAAYAGNGVYAASSTTVQLTVTAIGGFTLAVPNVTVSNGSQSNLTITVAPTGGYQGSIGYTVSSTVLATNTCYAVTSSQVTGTTATPGQLQIYDSATTCSGFTPLYKGAAKVAALDKRTSPAGSAPIGISLAGLLAIGLLGRRSKRLRGLVVVALLTVAGFGLSGCGEGGTTGTSTGTTSTTGTYTITVTGTDTVTPSVTSSTTFVLTLQ